MENTPLVQCISCECSTEFSCFFSLEFHRCESVQNLVVFFQICGIFLRLSLIFLIAVAGIILNWFLILSKNEPRVVLKLFS